MNPPTPQTEYEAFDTAAYLQEYYQEIGSENAFLVATAAEAYKPFADSSQMILEVGGGPTVYQIISSARAAKAIHFTDYSMSNLNEVKRWLSGGGFNWDEYIRIGLGAENKNTSSDALEERKALIRVKVTELSRYDIINDKLLQTTHASYDIVSSVFSSDAITHSIEGWTSVLINLSNRIVSGGHLILVGVTGSNAWVMGGQSFKATNLNEDIIKSTIDNLGYDLELFKTTPAEDGAEHGYDGVFYLKARKRS